MELEGLFQLSPAFAVDNSQFEFWLDRKKRSSTETTYCLHSFFDLATDLGAVQRSWRRIGRQSAETEIVG
jgi:hypothetical protein